MSDIAFKCPPSPRKNPQQRRSRQMVDIILESCKKILVEHGESALTVAVLEQVSGVTKGSIYQYYPSLNAIVAALFEREFVEFVQRGRTTVAAMHNPSLQELLQFLIGDAVAWHSTMYSLHSAFHDEYKLYYDAGKRFDELYSSREFARQYIAQTICREYGSSQLREAEEQSHLLLQMMNSLFFSALSHYPKKIRDPRYQRQILQACLAFISENQQQ